MTGTRSRLLVFHIGSLGDTLLSLPALLVLRAHVGPSAYLALLHNEQRDDRVAPSALLPHGLVDEVIPFASPSPSRRSFGELLRRGRDAGALLLTLRRRHFDTAVNLALADRSASALRRDRRFFRACGIPSLIGFDPVTPGPPERELRVERLRRAGIDGALPPRPWLEPGPRERASVDAWCAQHDIIPDRPMVTLAPGTLMPSKAWPSESWGEIGRRILASGCQVVVVGGPTDAELGGALVSRWGGGASAAGAFEPLGSAELMRRAVLHVGVDTGTTHLAACMGTPVVALYSHRAPLDQWSPVGGGHRIVHHPVHCAGCGTFTCPVDGHPCMHGIEVDEVWEEIRGALDTTPLRPGATR